VKDFEAPQSEFVWGFPGGTASIMGQTIDMTTPDPGEPSTPIVGINELQISQIVGGFRVNIHLATVPSAATVAVCKEKQTRGASLTVIKGQV
jgi:hypothetical protein